MKESVFDLQNLRIEISFKSFEELRSILSFYEKNNLYKINIVCKNNLKTEFLLRSIGIARKEFPSIDLIPHFSILHEFKKNRLNTLNSFIEFLHVVNDLGCKEVLLVSGSQKRKTLNSMTALSFIKGNTFFIHSNFSIGVAFNPYLKSHFFEDEIINLKKKLQSGLVSSIWIQFGTDYKTLELRLNLLKKIIDTNEYYKDANRNVKLFGSILVPSKQFLARFKFRPWKGVYCSTEFLESIDVAHNIVIDLFKTYKKNNIVPIIETDVSSEKKLNLLKTYIS
tara:strand:+ start:5378 stop:6220 length:843 start_codon:yes stop_codon:yes gene_type:complete